MDDSVHAALEALLKRFQELVTQFRENHAAWQEAVRAHDRPRQSALIVREGAILADVSEVMAAFQATIAQRHHWEHDAQGGVATPSGARAVCEGGAQRRSAILRQGQTVPAAHPSGRRKEKAC